MMLEPSDDPTWPRCSNHQNNQHWCDVIRDHMLVGADADQLDFGLRFCVPIVPMMDFYAEVSIGTPVTPICGQLNLVLGTDPFTVNEEFVHLGLWTQGEGRLVIASAIANWTELAPKECKSTTHGFDEEREVQQAAGDGLWAKANAWCIAYHGSCYPCFVRLQQAGKRAAGGMSEFNATSFGLDPDQFRQKATSSARRGKTAELLRQRYSNRVMNPEDVRKIF